jgi:pyruvate formate lyase activating enzyme
MTGIIFDIKRFAIHDGPGIRTTVFFKGCPLRCWWCQNPESVNSLQEEIKITPLNSSTKYCEEVKELFGRNISADELFTEINKDRIFFEESGGGVTFSGGEPMMQINFLKDVLGKCKADGIHTAIDTSGYAPAESFNRIYDLVDLFLFDLKVIDDAKHIQFTDVSNELIHQNFKLLCEKGNKVIIRLPLIPGITDTEQNIDDILSFIKTLKNIRRIDILPYNEIAEAKYKRFNRINKTGKLKTQSPEKLYEFRLLFQKLTTEVTIRG